MSVLIAQIITHILGFLIFFWILKKFAWGPVVALLDERRGSIEQEYAKLELKKKETEALRSQVESRLASIEQEARQKVNEAIDEGRKIAQEITDKARQDAQEIAQKAERNIRIEMDKARIELKQHVVSMTLQATERLLHERLDDAKHRDLVNRFVEQLEASRS